MSRIKPSDLQKLYRERFKEAVAYAKDISRNPEKKKAYQEKIGEGKRVYNAALKEYLGRKGQ